MRHRVCKRVFCPYYRHEDPQMIYCEGVNDSSVIHLAFADRAEAKQYKVSVCRSTQGYKNCRIYKMHLQEEIN